MDIALEQYKDQIEGIFTSYVDDSDESPTIRREQAVEMLKEITEIIFFDLTLAENVFNPEYKHFPNKINPE